MKGVSSGRDGASSAAALIAALSTWVAMCSWTGFAAHYGSYVRHLFVLALLIAGVGIALRLLRTPGPLVVLAQILAALAGASEAITGSIIPVGAAGARLSVALDGAMASAQTYAPPVPGNVPPIDPILILAGVGCLLLVDLLACTLRRVPLAGLPLLAIYSVPLAVLGEGVAWWTFALTALGFVTVLFLHELDAATRWGHALDSATGPSAGFGVSTGAIRVHAASMGVSATALAILLPIVVPTLSLAVFDVGRGGKGGSGVSLTNPMTDLQRDLRRGADVPLVMVRTEARDPSYLRIAVLTRFNGERWTTGDRDIPRDQRADGRLPAPVGVSPDVPRTSTPYQVSIDDDFDSTWLPTQSDTSFIEASGDWRYDVTTRDVLAADDDLDAAGLDYRMTATDLELSKTALLTAGSGVAQVPAIYSELPSDLPALVSNLADQVTSGSDSMFGKAVLLQDWFRTNFTYDLERAPTGNGINALEAFLSSSGDRRGYCEQFASAMAVMAREVGIPARVAVGFLHPDEIGPGTFVYSAHDLHAWPELYFPGSGWVRFEPTPGIRTGSVPAYTRGAIATPSEPGVTEPTAASSSAAPRPSQEPSRRDPREQEQQAATGSGEDAIGPALPIGIALGLLGAASALLTPRVMRRRARERRLLGSVEEIWLELRATARDLGMAWPTDRSPRETADRVQADLPDLRRCADWTSIIDALERSRYASAPPPSNGLGEAGRTVIDILEAHAGRRRRRRATWWPRTFFRPVPAATAQPFAVLIGR